MSSTASAGTADLTLSPAARSAILPFVVLGATCIVSGGLVAAATALSPSLLASWAVAYLVLVGGVTQVVIGIGQVLPAQVSPARRTVGAEIVGWNAGNGAVLAGTLLGVEWLADAGGGMLVAVLVLVLAGIRGVARRPAWPLYLYRALIALVLVSIPVGLVLGTVRPH